MFSYLSPEQRVPVGHPLRRVREITDRLLVDLSDLFDQMYSTMGRPSIAPEKLLRALLLQVLYTIRSERMLIEQLDYNLLFRWFVGLNMDDAVWDVTVFTKNRDRLLKAEVARRFFDLVVEEARGLDLMSDEHFTVDGTLLEACAGLKSFKNRDGVETAPPDDPGNPRQYGNGCFGDAGSCAADRTSSRTSTYIAGLPSCERCRQRNGLEARAPHRRQM